MIRFLLQELMSEKLFRDGKKVTVTQISEGTGISRVTLSKMLNQRGYNATTDNLDKLCEFFNCRIEDLIQYVPEREVNITK